MLKLASFLLWAVTVSISGPQTAAINELITLKSESKGAVKTKWVVPETFKFIASPTGELHVMPTKPGTFSVCFMGVGEEFELVADMHQIQVVKKDEEDSN